MVRWDELRVRVHSTTTASTVYSALQAFKLKFLHSQPHKRSSLVACLTSNSPTLTIFTPQLTVLLEVILKFTLFQSQFSSLLLISASIFSLPLLFTRSELGSQEDSEVNLNLVQNLQSVSEEDWPHPCCFPSSNSHPLELEFSTCNRQAQLAFRLICIISSWFPGPPCLWSLSVPHRLLGERDHTSEVVWTRFLQFSSRCDADSTRGWSSYGTDMRGSRWWGSDEAWCSFSSREVENLPKIPKQ